ncbi:hypothetical protein WJX84_001799 [Apatococcus fuscideae]|uniref:leucine--tRNA ligase n=1 Tax=Apatococcus fuscideae TaxID=2026836 RepID=A0AAW1SZQ7_9CHLO
MSKPAEAPASQEPPKRGKRDLLKDIERKYQQKWAEDKIFEISAPTAGNSTPDNKFFGNFPYPYSNGVLHIGHAFSLSKNEFRCAFERLCGKHVLFAQGIHCTGMPIKACADRLDQELRDYGVPPKFPEPQEVPPEVPVAATAAAQGELTASGKKQVAKAAKTDLTKFSSNKSKATAKKGAGKTQWDILVSSGLPSEDIPLFRQATLQLPHWLAMEKTQKWLDYFPAVMINDMKSMGCGIDWRRSFVTTDANPFYDNFVQWQFRRLHRQGCIVKDKRYAVYSPKDGQPCADHDRASGEGAGPQEYTLIKMQAVELQGKLKALEGKGPVFLMAATLRPETMYGQTNCWALPKGQYGAFRGLDGEVWVMTHRAARNLAFQDRTPEAGKAECLLELQGSDLIGLPLKAPNSGYDKIFVLPLLTIKTNKGTGIVTSVPSDAPDDFAALQDLRTVKEDAKLKEKFNVERAWVEPFEVIEIIEIPGLGRRAAETLCKELNITNQHQAEKLATAKDRCYLKGFTDGVMIVGPHSGKKVSEAKPIIKDEMIAAGQALTYNEPEKEVISRSGDECVVALTDQWYLTYNDPEWKAAARKALEQMETYAEETRTGFEYTLGWLQQWALSREFGLGTRLPADPAYLIESLSDSTIYMAYYTIAHFLQGNDLFGKGKNAGVRVEDLTDEVWDHIFLGKAAPTSSSIPSDILAAMRREFEFWYPWDLRTSGKDLVGNHLSFSIFHHTAIWKEQPHLWPRSIRCNGHLMLNSMKMSKSTGMLVLW